MHWFYTPHIDGDTALLSEEESHHALKVLRLTPGTAVVVTDGDGHGWQAHIGERAGKNVVCKLGTSLPQQQKPNLTLVIAPTKNTAQSGWWKRLRKLALPGLCFFSVKTVNAKICAWIAWQRWRWRQSSKVSAYTFQN